MKVFALPAEEDWICDRFVQEWNAVSGIAAKSVQEADIIWLLSDWRWEHVPREMLGSSRLVVATVHHIVPEKFDDRALQEFKARDWYVDAYHVPCNKTRDQVKLILNSFGVQKTIFVRPFWMNQGLWHRDEKMGHELRLELGFAENDFVVGSFQRDTEGHDLKSPKLEKGPDLFCDAVIRLHKIQDKTKVLLSGWRRQYVIGRLEAAGVPYVYVERPSLPAINDFYNCLDTYFVASRYEGGPQAILECATIGVPIVSRDVGIASEILHPQCIGDDLVDMICNYDDEHLEYAQKKVRELYMPHGIKPFVDFFDTFEKRTKFSQISPGIGGRKSDV